jgi:hypothetical protein
MADVLPFRSPVEDEPPPLFTPDTHLRHLVHGGEYLTKHPVFGDDDWDMAGHPAWRDKAGRQTRIKFSAIPPRWRLAAKELALLQMSPHLAPLVRPDNAVAQAWPQLQEPIGPSTAQTNIKGLAAAIRAVSMVDFNSPEAWQQAEALLPQPASVSDKSAGVTLSANTVRHRAQQLAALWQTTQIGERQYLLGTHRPWGGQTVSGVFAKTTHTNAVRPHERVGDVLGYVAWFFDNIAENIVDHVEWWSSNIADDVPLSIDAATEDMLDLFRRIAAENGNELPARRQRNGQVSLAAASLGRLVGIFDATEADTRARSALKRMHPKPALRDGLTPCPVPIAMVTDSQGMEVAWSASLLPAKDELDIWQRRLVYYAMYYLSATIMLRDSQLATLPVDCLQSEEVTKPSGVRYLRHTVSAFKTKNRHAPVPTTVVVNGRIARIIQLLHRLQQALGYEAGRSSRTGLPCLFDHQLALPIGKRAHSRSRDGMYLDQQFLKHMRDGAHELYERGVVKRDLADVSLSMRQVRITCAQAYAVREHGQALAAAYGQWDTAAVARGYIGDVYRLITPLEPDETQELARQDIGRRLVDAAMERGDPTGKGLKRLNDAVQRNRGPLSNPQALTPARLKSLGKANPNIEQGPLTLCVFQVEGALCGGKGKPDFRLCLPGQCRNSVMTMSDRARYELMRRQHLQLSSPVLRRAADRMHDANPAIAEEFAALDDDAVAQIVKDHVDEYIRRALEGTA